MPPRRGPGRRLLIGGGAAPLRHGRIQRGRWNGGPGAAKGLPAPSPSKFPSLSPRFSAHLRFFRLFPALADIAPSIRRRSDPMCKGGGNVIGGNITYHRQCIPQMSAVIAASISWHLNLNQITNVGPNYKIYFQNIIPFGGKLLLQNNIYFPPQKIRKHSNFPLLAIFFSAAEKSDSPFTLCYAIWASSHFRVRIRKGGKHPSVSAKIPTRANLIKQGVHRGRTEQITFLGGDTSAACTLARGMTEMTEKQRNANLR